MVAFFGGTGGTVGTVDYGTGKSFSEALLFAEHEENMLCTKIVSCFCFDIQNNLCAQHVLLMFSQCSLHVLSLEFSCTELVIQWTIFCHIVG